MVQADTQCDARCPWRGNDGPGDADGDACQVRVLPALRKVLVINEVHAYDAFMSVIIERLLQWCVCMKIPVVLLSATLSARQRAAMINVYGATGGDNGCGDREGRKEDLR